MTQNKLRWSPHSYSFDSSKQIFTKNNITASPYEDLEQEEYSPHGMMIPFAGTVIETPLGIFNVDDELNPYKNFEFWLCHSNFDITKSVAETIIDTPGVEVFRPITRYRFLLGVGDLFPFQDVRASLQEKLCGTSVDINALVARVNELEILFSQQGSPEWVIYIYPTGKLEFAYLEPDESNAVDYNEKKGLLIQAESLSNGKLYLHERPDREVTPTEESPHIPLRGDNAGSV